MHIMSTISVVVGLLSSAQSFSIPPNVQSFYDAHKSTACTTPLASGFQPYYGGSDFSSQYCGDVPGVIYGYSSTNGGQYWDMDIDCDGANRQAGKCANDPTGQSQTAFQDQVRAISGLDDLDANVHPYVVFGNSGASPSFDPQQVGMAPLSVMAVVCNKQLWYGIWGDTNGGTTTGEASISLAELCFPDEDINGDNGHEPQDVLFIGFISGDTAPSGANWNAGGALDFSNSIKAVGDGLVAGI